MSGIVRQSKFRHVFCKPVKHEQCMSDIRITEITWDSLFCALNTKFIAFICKGAGGPFLVIPVNKVGRVEKDYPFVDAHRAPCLEVAWSPFNDNVIASCSEDTTCKVWVIPPNGLTRNLTEPAVELSGHQKRVNTLAWHPTANNILLTAGGENKLLIWNVGTGEALLEVSGHPDMIWSVSFNYDGSRFVTTCKDKKIRVIDSHTGDVLHEGMGHEGVKPQRAIFLQDDRIFTTGFTKRSERLYAIRTQEKLDEPLVQEDLDTGNAVLFPLYDEDSGLIYLAGKGDCAIRYYEVNNDPPFVHYINTYTTSEPQRAIGFMPKLGLNSSENEIARIFKVTTKGVVDELQFFVPRKSDLYQPDLYPDTRSCVPALTAEEFVEGKNAPPNLVPVNLAAAADAKPKIQVAKKANILAQLPHSQEPAGVRSAGTTRSDEVDRRKSSYEEVRRDEPSHHQSRPVSMLEPTVDNDTGIIRLERSSSSNNGSEREQRPPNPMLVRQQMQLRSRSDRDDNGQTPGQRRAAAELERIKREQGREPDRDELGPPSQRHPNSVSPRQSVAPSEPSSMEELVQDVHKMKAILRQHERRIRLLEDQIADRNMTDTYGF